MFNSGNCASIPLVANLNGGYNQNYGGYGMDGGWFAWWIIAMAMFGYGGFGGYGGYGGGGYAAQQFTQADMQRGFDTQNILRQINSDCRMDNRLRDTALYITDNLNPQPRPAFRVPNPHANYYDNCYYNQNNDCSDCGGCNRY